MRTNVNLLSIIIPKYFAYLTTATGVELIVTVMLSSTDRLIFGVTIVLILDFEGFIVCLFTLTHFRIFMISKLIVDFKFDSESVLRSKQVSSANNLGVEEMLLTMSFI